MMTGFILVRDLRHLDDADIRQAHYSRSLARRVDPIRPNGAELCSHPYPPFLGSKFWYYEAF